MTRMLIEAVLRCPLCHAPLERERSTAQSLARWRCPADGTLVTTTGGAFVVEEVGQ